MSPLTQHGDNQHNGRTTTTHRVERKVTVDEKMIDLITKSTLLSVIGMTSSSIVVIYLLSLAGNTWAGPSVGMAIRGLDAVINIVCMYLVLVWFGWFGWFGLVGLAGW